MSALGAWLARHETVHGRGIDLGLDRLAKVAGALGLRKPAPLVITVAGTNGKGSTVALLEQLVLAAGLKVGTFTSPHLFRYNERIRIANREATDAELVAAFERIESARGDITLTFFEFNALAAFLILGNAQLDVALLEVGLGGRLDAVNLIDADAAIVCSIGFDHRDWLGETLELIGREKAGVFRSGAVALLATAAMPRSVYDAASSAGARLVVAGRDYFWSGGHGAGGSWNYSGPSIALTSLAPPALEGILQIGNAAAAIAVLEATGVASRLTAEAISTALQLTHLPGRFQRIVGGDGIEWIFDVAHNAPAAAALATNLAALPPAHTIAIAGILSDKDAPAILSAVLPCIDDWIFCSLEGPRGRSAAQLAEAARDVVGAPSLVSNVAAGCVRARQLAKAGDRIVVFGSFHAVGPALAFLRLY